MVTPERSLLTRAALAAMEPSRQTPALEDALFHRLQSLGERDPRVTIVMVKDLMPLDNSELFDILEYDGAALRVVGNWCGNEDSPPGEGVGGRETCAHVCRALVRACMCRVLLGPFGLGLMKKMMAPSL